jgi:hypothetical protein
MKNFFLATLVSLIIGTISCTSCTSSQSSIPPADAGNLTTVVSSASASTKPIASVPIITNLVVANDNWQFTLPDSNWVSKNPEQLEVKSIKVNNTTHSLLVFLKESYAGSYQDYVLIAIRGLKESGAILISSTQVNINGNNFIVTETTANDLRMWLWMTVKNGNGYGFSCGGSATDETQHDICFSIASTLKIN